MFMLDERLVGQCSPILHSRILTDVQFKLVNIVHHLTRDSTSIRSSLPNPTDLDTAKAIIAEVHYLLI